VSTDLLERRAAARAPIEPRLRARRIEVARDQGRRRLRRVLVLLALVAVAAAGVAIVRSPLLDVDRVTVRGTEAGADAVREASGVVPGDALISIDAGAVADRVEDLPWVAEARVARDWSGTVAISVTPRVPVAVVGSGTGTLLDAEGVAIGAAPDDVDLPRIDADAPDPGEVADESTVLAAGVLADLATTCGPRWPRP